MEPTAGRAPLAALNLAAAPPPRTASKPPPGPLSFTQFHTGWMDKQEAAFKAWLNAVLQPAATDGEAERSHGGLASRRLVARLRGLLWQIYSQDQELVSVMLKVEQRIDGGQLKLRDAELCMKSVKEAANARAVLASYHPLWLRLGMEVVTGQAVAADDAPASAADLAAFVRDRFMKDPQLAKQHSTTSKAYWVALARLVLKRFLLLAALLDRAVALPSLPGAAPLLFRVDSKIKGSAQVVTELLQSRLAGEGDVLRTLGRLGYKLAYVQDPRRELNFEVANLATDLRDGLRLCKLAELLTGKNVQRFFDSTRYPSDRRPVRVANLQLALEQFARAGLPLRSVRTHQGKVVTLAAADLVDGDREMTLCLLWRLILHFQLPQLISLSAVRTEIDLVRAKTGAAGGDDVCSSSLAAFAGQDAASEAAGESVHAAALLEWAQAVCAQYKLPVRSFGPCFSDGSVFCLLVHFYLGNAYVALRDVQMPLQQPVADASGEAQMGFSPVGMRMAGQLERARSNFAIVQRVVELLGGIPAMVSAEDFAEHGHDEKGCILFTAFLCHRLLEISKEERAAMVIQRHWRNRHQNKPGTARKHLRKWIAAASVVQRAVRAWRLRLGLERFAAQQRRALAAVVRLQALWRARPAYRRYRQLRQAAICVQAAYRGKMARRQVFHHVVVPRMLEAGLRCKRELEASRYEGRLERAAIKLQALRRGSVLRLQFLQQRSAAVAIQAAVRGHQQRARFLQQRSAAVAIQAGWRRHVAQQQLAQAKAAATAVQTAWRRWHTQRQYQQLRAAAVAVQAAWRARQARLLLQQHKAALRIQASWRGYALRKELDAQQAAAVCIQAAWRSFAARRAFLKQRLAAVVVQAAVRRAAARRRFLLSKQAAVRIQAVWRGFAVRHLLHRNHAATAIQSHVRGFLARRRLQQQHAAATTIQRAVRAFQARKRAAAVAALKQQMAEMARLMQQYAARTAAALRIQAAYRGHQGRKEYRRLLAEQQERLRLQREREAAALAVLAPWAQTFMDRLWFLRARRAAPVLQAWWRREFARRQAAAVTIQAAVRCFLAQRRMQRSRRAALVLQTAWRGSHVRTSHPHRKQLADIRLRLAAAAANAANAPHRSLGNRTRAHLDALLASKHPVSAIAALNGLALTTEAVLACGDIVVAGGGLPVLLGIVKSSSRSKEAADALRAALQCLSNISRSRQRGDTVFEAEGLLPSLGEHLQQQREKEDVFMAVVGLWQRLVCGHPARALSLARQPEVLAKLEGVARLLTLKQTADQKYLVKLEQQKGSDRSARTATKALLATTRQLRALRAVLAAAGASPELLQGGASEGGGGQPAELGKNTLVREVLRSIK
ncbi:hypothetical protein ABPG75_001190 [Micractinium tetrahymenae]